MFGKWLTWVVSHSGIKTQYNISVKTSDIRYAGTDANVFIQIAGVNGGITPKLKLDDAKNNFERNMVDNFEVGIPYMTMVGGHIFDISLF